MQSMLITLSFHDTRGGSAVSTVGWKHHLHGSLTEPERDVLCMSTRLLIGKLIAGPVRPRDLCFLGIFSPSRR
jgi:hypothetical protein